MNVNLSRVVKTAKAAWLPLAVAVALLGAVPIPAARAQTAPPPPPDPIEIPSAVNPFPNPLADAQNRGRSGFDLYWGLTDSNFLWNQTPLSRIPDQNGNEYVELSGWTYPYAIDNKTADGVAYGRYINLNHLPLSTYNSPSLVQDDQPQQTGATPPATTPALPAAGTSYTTGTGVWDVAGAAPLPGGLVTGPSLNPLNGNYHRTVAVQRPTGNAFNYFLTNGSFYGAGNAGKRNNIFTWFPSVPGTGGQIIRYAIRVILPDITTSDPNENRVTDARYLVHYYVRTSAGLQGRYKICFVGQDADAAGSSKYLSETPGGTPAYFPFFTENTYNPADPGFVAVPDGREFVAVDNTTADDLANGTEYVLADGLSFEQRVAAVHAAPTLTPYGAGRKINTAAVPVQQPVGGPTYSVDAATVGTVTGVSLNAAGAQAAATGLVMPNSSFAFANADPRDPDYAAGGALAGKYDPNNPTVLFQGPEAFAKPKILPSQYGAPYGTASGPGVGTYDPVPQPALPTNLVATGAKLNAVQNILPVPPTAAVPAGDSGGTRLQYNPQFPPLAYNNLTPDAAQAPFAQQIATVSANNFEIYRPNMGDGAAPTYDLVAGTNRPVPLYSHLQVIVARTVYVPDPEIGVPASQVDGTRTIEVGEVLGLDWQTGAVLWRFPDRTYLPDVESALAAEGVGVTIPHGYPEPGFVNAATGIASQVAPQSGLRNAFIGFQTVTSPTGVTVNAYPLYQVPGIVAYDLNGDGRIEDNEVFIGPTPGNASGGLYAGVTVAGRIPVQGRVKIPLYKNDQSIPNLNDGSPIIGVADAPTGRYSDATGNPVPVTTAFVASQNGVVYAIDAHGNNDNRYREAVYNNNAANPEFDPTNPDPNSDPQSGQPRHNTAGPKRFGTFHAGTTNVLWTFSAQSAPRLIGQRLAAGPPQFETLLQYHQRVKGEVPATLGFGSSAPVIAYRYDDNDIGPIGPEGLAAPAGYLRTTLGTAPNLFGTDEPRLFVGNQNGSLYALDASALTVGPTAPGVTNLPYLPFHKGEQPSAVTTDLAGSAPGGSPGHRTDLKWWFETEAQSAAGGGAINGAPAVSLNRLAANLQADGISAASTDAEKGVYFSSAAGRVYCVDWTGPVRADDVGHFFTGGTGNGRNWDGKAGTLTTLFPPNAENGAATFNDNYRFHNQFSASPRGVADFTEGTIRPRWVYPSQYTDINGDGKVNAGDSYNAPDATSNTASAGNPIRDTTLAPLGGAVSLMDFVWTKPGTITPVIKHYVTFAGNDNVNPATTPVTGKLYLLDQAGDRGAFLTNPMITSGALKRAYSSPIDQFALKTEAVGAAAPAWTYRFQYGTYDTAGNLIIQGTNNGTTGSPTTNPNQSLNHPTPVDPVTELPLNQATDVNLAQPSRRTLPTIFFGGVGRVWAVDIDQATGVFTRWRVPNAPNTLQPVPLPLNAGGVQAGVVPTQPESKAYILPWFNPDVVKSPVGNLYTQQILARTVPLPSTDGSSVDGSLTIAGGPLQTRDSNFNLVPALANLPMVPPHPTNDPPALEPLGYGRDAAQTTPLFANRLDPTGRYVNQEIDDPLATTRGSHYIFATDANTPANVRNVSFQFPALFFTTAGSTSASSATSGGGLYEVSTNLDGEDTAPLTNAVLGNESANLGWAFSNDLSRFNENGHVYQLSIAGPGGTGSGVAVMTAAYFPGLDPNFRTNKTATYPVGDPTAATFPRYPDYEPGIEPNDPVTGAVPVARNTDLHQSGGVLHPRGFFAGDATVTPNLGADYATGLAGLPLDANGLFFEKKSALRDVTGDSAFPFSVLRWIWGGTNTLTTTQDDGQIALPGWSGFLAALPAPPTGIPNGLPDGIRPRQVTVGATVQNGNNDDVNPTASNAIWIFSGGPDGALYAYTPALPRRFGGSGGSGLAGGTVITTNPPPYLNPQPKFDIFPAAYATGLNGSARPDRAQSLAATSHNFFEWGESIYVVAWDFAVGVPTYSGAQPPYLANPPSQFTIQIIDSKGNQIQRITATKGAGANATGRILPGSYPYSANYFPGLDPLEMGNQGISGGPPLGVAVFRYDLNGSTKQTPGTILKVRMDASDLNSAVINPNTGGRAILGRPAGGALSAQIVENQDIPFMIANPLAVQAFVTDTRGRVATIGVNPTNYTIDSIGPFEMNGATTKNKVAANTGQGTPDNRSIYYSQALSNGNLIQRFDLSPYTTYPTRNKNLGNKLTLDGTNGGTPDNDYYIPVVVDAGYGSDGGSATTDTTTPAGLARYLHVVNRSVLRSGLPKVRAQVMDDMIWRSWPGNVPNEDATDGGTISGGPLDGTPSKPGGANPRRTPVDVGGNYGMRADGIVNFLPWEQPATETQPWKSATTTSSLATGGNSSQDYPDIPALSQSGASPAISASSGSGGDPTRGSVTLQPAGDPATVVNTNLNNANSGFALEQNPVLTGANTLLGMALNVNVPKYQPANLVAMHSLTSTYVAPSTLTDTLGGITTTASAPVQLPYTGDATTTQTAHLLQVGGADTIAPFGYTTTVRIFVDTDGNGKWDEGEAYRDVELWMGVPVDMNLASVESPVEISGPNGSLAMGFGLQNGFLGYNMGGADFRQGFLPTPLADPTIFPVTSSGTPTPYSPFFKKFTIQNRGNVNLWNLRASQRGSATLTGSPYAYYQLRSTAVDPVQGVQAVGMDPNLGTAPQVVTSLDPNLDNAWDTLTNPASSYDPFSLSAATYTRYYQGFGGRHPLHKAHVGSNTDTILSIPDMPSAVDLGNVNGGGATVAITPQVPYVSVALPIGTPSGIYGPPDTAPADFFVFEDHDTASQYQAAPLPNGTGPALMAGPTYNGTDLLYPAKGASVLPNTGAGIYRPRALPPLAGAAVPASDYLPHTDPGIRLRVTVGEGALTGQVVDQALPMGPTPNPSVTNGILPFVDTEPLIDATGAAGPRAAAALSPAAYRDPTGSLHLFFARNSNATNANGTAQPGSFYNLFSSDLLWDPATGQWVAKTPAPFPVPTAPAKGNYSAAGGPTGQWFTTPQQIGVVGQPAGSSDTSPSVLQDTSAAGGGAATLFFLNTVPVAGGQSVRTIYYAPLTTVGGVTTVGAAQPWLQNADPSLQRYSPRAVLDPVTGTDLLFYFGGVSSKWALYYSPRGAAPGGAPNDALPNAATTQSEFPLSVPLSITTASDPVPVVRQIVPVGGTTAQTYVDVYYTGVARTDTAPNLYMTRYLLASADTPAVYGGRTRLAPVPLARHKGELLTAATGSPLFRSRDIAWIRDLRDPANLPALYLNGGGASVVNPLNWRYDDTTNMLVQKIVVGGQAVFVYVDTSAGTVRFRGTPSVLATIQTVTADYTPQTARVTSGGVSSSGAFGFYDDRVLPDSNTEQAQIQQVVSPALPSNYILARPNSMVAGRTWLFWRQAATGANGATLQYATRRVGVDLKAIASGGMSSASATSPGYESIALSAATTTAAPPVGVGVQVPQIAVAIDGTPTTNFEVDTANGRVYVDPAAEGHQVTVTYGVVTATGAPANGSPRTATATLGQIQDLDPTKSSQQYNGKAVGLVRSINEGQPYAFLDRYDGRGSVNRSGVAGAPNPQFDPTLQPGKVWLFWTSPRSRSGALRDAATGNPLPPINGYDVYWQTMAPWFSYDAFRPVP